MAGLLESGILLLILSAAPPARPPPTRTPPADYCIDCHQKREEPRLSVPTATVAKSVHASLEFPCAGCHGGDPRDPSVRAHNPTLGFRGKPKIADVPELCGGCHANALFIRQYSAALSIDQLALYKSSYHGVALAQGKEDVATCISCHGHHGVKAVNDPSSPVQPEHVADTCGKCHANPKHRAASLVAGNPVVEWKRSQHALAMFERGNLAAPTCNDCHGDHGAGPPGRRNIHSVCGHCHANESERFRKSVHAEPFERLGFGECNECHERHEITHPTDELLSDKTDGKCRQCHDEGKAPEVARELRARVTELVLGIEDARDAIADATAAGLVLYESPLAERRAFTALQEVRTAVHGMRMEALAEPSARVRSDLAAIHDEIERARLQLELRRKGYYVFIGLAVALIGLLLLKLRSLPKVHSDPETADIRAPK